MASLEEIVSVVITRSSAQVSRASFGVPLIAAYHTHWTDRYRLYSAISMLSTLVDEGFSTASPTYQAAQAMLAQSPRPSRIAVGRLDGTWTQTIVITPTYATTGTVFSGRVNDQPWSYTQQAGDLDADDVATGIAGAIDALTGVGAAAVADDITITVGTVATIVDVVYGGAGTGVYTISDTTGAGTIAADLAVLRNAYAGFYGLVLDRQGEGAINAAATWAETQRVIFTASSADSGIYDPAVTTDVASDNATRKRTGIFAHPVATTWYGAAMLGLMLPYDPGSASWAHKSPAGVPDPALSAAQQAAAIAKDANILVTVGGLTDSQWGTSGTDYLDNVQAEDWLVATIQEDVYAFLRSAPKIPYTDRSVSRLKDVILGVCRRGIERNIVADDPAPLCEAPLVADVSPVDRANRVLPDVYFSCRLTGGIHTVQIQGLVSL